MASKGKVECLDDYRVGNDGGVVIIGGGVNGISTGEGIGGGHLGTRKDFPDDIKVLEEKTSGPVVEIVCEGPLYRRDSCGR